MHLEYDLINQRIPRQYDNSSQDHEQAYDLPHILLTEYRDILLLFHKIRVNLF